MRVHSLTTRFVLTLLLSTAVPFLVFGLFVRQGMQERMERQVVRVLLRDQASLVAERLDAFTEQVYRNCSQLRAAATQVLAGGRVDELEAELDLLPYFHRDYQHVLVADGEGRVLATVDGMGVDGQRRAAIRALAPDAVADQAWFQACRHGGKDVVWLDRHLSPLLHRNVDKVSQDPADYSLGVALSVQDERGRRGVVLALAHWQRVQEVLDRITERLHEDAGFPGGEVFLCDPAGELLAHSRRARYGRPVGPLELIERIRHPAGGAATVVSYQAEEWRDAGVTWVGQDGYRDLDWRCGVSIPRRELYATSREFGQLVLLLTGAAVIALLVWSMFASRAVLRPVHELASATERLAEGDLTARVRVRSQDELGDLAGRFNEMASELAASREALRDAERQAAWAEMARQIAHEIKNPLTPMRMAAQMVQRARAKDDPRLGELVDRLARTVVDQTEQLTRIASDFRQFAGQPERQLTEIDVGGLLEAVREHFAPQAEQRGVRLVISFADARITVRGDRGELARVFTNLVQNALLAGPRSAVEIRVGSTAARVVFGVLDDGPGIPPDVVEHLFEPYFTTRSSGTGLGLAICRRIVESHGGQIRLASGEPGRTEFRFDLPLGSGGVPDSAANGSDAPKV